MKIEMIYKKMKYVVNVCLVIFANRPCISLCIAYAKQVPFVEDSRRVVIAISHVKKIYSAVEHAHTDDKPIRFLTWETHIAHSIRNKHEDGFVIPYQQMMEYCKTHSESNSLGKCKEVNYAIQDSKK